MLLYLILLVGGFGLTLLLLKLASGPSASKALKRRIELVKERHAEGITAAAQAQMRRLLAARVNRLEGFASTIIPRPALLRKRLEMTGKNITLSKYLMISVGLAVTVMALLLLRGAPVFLAIFVGLFAGIGVPHFVVSRLIKKRINKFNASFPDAIDLMVRGLRSGLPITETLGIVAAEIGGPVGVEFRVIADKMKIGRTMEAALEETADRLGTAEFHFFVISLAIQRETGGNLAETLSNLSDVLRKRAQMKLKIRAMSSESKASAYIVGALPFVVFALVFVLNPEYMGQFFIDERLTVAGIGGLVWMSIGGFVMAKMVNFEI